MYLFKKNCSGIALVYYFEKWCLLLKNSDLELEGKLGRLCHELYGNS